MITERPGGHQHDRRGGAGGVGRARDGDPAVGLLQRGGVVDAVAGHPDDVPLFLEDVDDVELVLGEDLGEAVGVLDRRGHRFGLVTLCVAETAGVEDVGAQPQLLGGLLGDRERVAGDHLHLHPKLPGGGEGRLRVLARRVKQRQHADQLPRAVSVGAGDAQGSKAARRELVDSLINETLHLAGVRGQLKDHLRRALGHLERGAVWRRDGGLGALTDRVKRLKMRDVIRLQDRRGP